MRTSRLRFTQSQYTFFIGNDFVRAQIQKYAKQLLSLAKICSYFQAILQFNIQLNQQIVLEMTNCSTNNGDKSTLCIAIM